MNSYCSKIAAAALGAFVGTAAIGSAQAQDYQPGVVLVKTATGAQGRVASTAIAQRGATVIRQLGFPGWKVLKLGAGEDVPAALTRLRRTNGVLVAEPNYYVHASKIPNDKMYADLYGMTKINAPQAWDVGQGNEEVVVGVLDSGVAYNHEDLKANMWRNPDEIPNNGLDDDNNGWADDVFGFDAAAQDGNPDDENGHGTHVAGTIGAAGNNGIGVTGVNWRVKIMALRGLGADGTGNTLGLIDALNYALKMKARGVNLRVINHSYGGYFYSSLQEEAFLAAADAGIVNIAAAGNGDLDGVGDDNDLFPFYPANYEANGLISVAASDDLDAPAVFTNFGATSVDLAAPGVDILSTYIGSKTPYLRESGTSMASPCVAGAAALLLSRSPGLSPSAVREQLMSSVDVLEQWQGRVVSGGRLNLAKLFTNNVYIVHGTVTVDNAGAPPIVGASVFVDGATQPSAVTDEKGNYKIGGLANGQHKVKVTLKGWTFSPAESTLTVSRSTPNVRRDFKGKASTSQYIISGRVTLDAKNGSLPVPGVAIYLDNATQPLAVTDTDGRYKIRHRSAGRYTVRAEKADYSLRYAKNSAATAVINLPVSPTVSEAIVNFKATLIDDKAPIVAINRPLFAEEIRQDFPVTVNFKATDDTGVVGVYFYLINEGGFYYDWRTGTFGLGSNIYKEIPVKQVRKVIEDTFTISNLPVGRYYLFGSGVDTLGNFSEVDWSTNFTIISSEGGNLTWPTVAITSPAAGAKVPAGNAITVQGTYTSDENVEAIFLRVLRYDEYGRVLGAYDWTTGKFISDTTRFSTYKKITQTQKSGTWKFTLPALPAGTYAVNAFGRTISGNEPPPGRTEDARVKFTYGGTISSAKSAASSVKGF